MADQAQSGPAAVTRTRLGRPLWRRAIAAGRETPGVLVAVAAATAVLAATSAAVPLVRTALATDAVHEAIERARETGDLDAGADVRVLTVGAGGELLEELDAQLRAALTSRAGAAPVRTFRGTSLQGSRLERGPEGAVIEHRSGVRRPAGDRTVTVGLFAQDGADELVELVDGSPGDEGVWLPRTIAAELALDAGDDVEVVIDDVATTVPVAAVYEDVVRDGAPVATAPVAWRGAGAAALPRARGSAELVPPLLVHPDGLPAVAAEVGEEVAAMWDVRAPRDHPSLADLRGAAADLDELRAAALDPATALGRAALEHTPDGTLVVRSGLTDLVTLADAVLAATRPTTVALGRAGQIVAGLLVAGAALALVRERRSELLVLDALGEPVGSLGWRAPLTCLPAVVAGSVVGWVAALALVEALPLASAATRATLWAAVVAAGSAAAAAPLVIGVVAAVAAASEVRAIERAAPRPAWRGVWWEPTALVVAAVAALRPSSGPGLDPLAVLLPLLALTGVAGLVARALTAVLHALGRRPSPDTAAADRSSWWLATRRLGAGGPQLRWLLTVLSVAVGLSVYAAVLADSTEEVAAAKAAALAGAEATVRIEGADQLATGDRAALGDLVRAAVEAGGAGALYDGTLRSTFAADLRRFEGGLLPVGVTDEPLPELGRDPLLPALAAALSGPPDALPPETTVVWHRSTALIPGGLRVRLLVVDRATFLTAAAWHPAFAPERATEVLGVLDQQVPGGTAAIAVAGPPAQGEVPAQGLLPVLQDHVPYRVVARTAAFPGVDTLRPTLVVDAAALLPLVPNSDPTLPVELQTGRTAGGFQTEVWGRDAATVTSLLDARGAEPLERGSVAEAAQHPLLVAATGALGLLRALGLAVAALAAIALVVYAEQRRAARTVAVALMRRMGFPSRREARAVALELAVLVALGVAAGTAVGVAVVAVVVGGADPLPIVPPSPVLTVHLATLAAPVLSATVLVVGTTALVRRRAANADLAEALDAVA